MEIIQEDGEYVGQQYDTREVGRIDLLCKNKNTGDFVVIELKKARRSIGKREKKERKRLC